jgi:predicted AlkP superfamily phosphohydrolase/phosphomutase
MNRALAVGLDGMTLDLLHRLAAEGVMPAAAALLESGPCAELVAPVPEISSTSWASFLTGVNPARHGVFGFVDLLPGGYDTFYADARTLAAPTMWEVAARAGLRTACLNVPGTYPAPTLHGALVSGFVAPRLSRAVFPPRLAGTLSALDYELDMEIGDVAADPHAFLARAVRALRARVRGFEAVLGRDGAEPDWDLGVAVITETDRVQHFLWGPLDDPGHPLHDAVVDFYREVDAALARLVALVDDEDALFLVSDHGFGPATCQFALNGWLREGGWLAPAQITPRLTDLDARSQAFALDPARVYLHRKSRFPSGSLSDEDADAVRDEIADELRALRRDGTRIGPDVDGPPVFDAVETAAQVYSGPLLERGADLLATPALGVQPRGTWAPAATVGTDVFTGTHTRGNAIFHARGADRDRFPARVDMTDVAPTLLGALGVDTPDMDGRAADTGRRAQRTTGGTA